VREGEAEGEVLEAFPAGGVTRTFFLTVSSAEALAELAIAPG
jgi:hypothetical protein